MKISKIKLQFSFAVHQEFPTMTQRHKFIVRDQDGRGKRLKMVNNHLKTKENVAGLGSKLNSKWNQKNFSYYLRTACLLEKMKILI